MSFLLTDDRVDAELILLLDLDGSGGTSLMTLLERDVLCCLDPSVEETDTVLTMLLDLELIPFFPAKELLGLEFCKSLPKLIFSLAADSGVEDLCLKGANLFLRDFSLGAAAFLGIGLRIFWLPRLSLGELTSELLL